VNEPISVAALSKASVYDRSLAGIAGSNPAVGMGVSYECCVHQVEVSVFDHSSGGVLPSVVCLSVYREASILRKLWPTRKYCVMGKKSRSNKKIQVGIFQAHRIISLPKKYFHFVCHTV